MKQKKLGKFIILDSQTQKCPNAVRGILKQVDIINTERLVDKTMFTGVSDMFDEISTDIEIPEYEFNIINMKLTLTKK